MLFVTILYYCIHPSFGVMQDGKMPELTACNWNAGSETAEKQGLVHTLTHTHITFSVPWEGAGPMSDLSSGLPAFIPGIHIFCSKMGIIILGSRPNPISASIPFQPSLYHIESILQAYFKFIALILSFFFIYSFWRLLRSCVSPKCSLSRFLYWSPEVYILVQSIMLLCAVVIYSPELSVI